MFKHKAALVLACGMSLAGGVAWGADAGAVAKGGDIYQARCMHCHGPEGDGKGHLIEFLKVKPANLTQLARGRSQAYVTDSVLKAVLGRHEAVQGPNRMPLLKEYLSAEEVYYLSEFLKTKQR